MGNATGKPDFDETRPEGWQDIRAPDDVDEEEYAEVPPTPPVGSLATEALVGTREGSFDVELRTKPATGSPRSSLKGVEDHLTAVFAKEEKDEEAGAATTTPAGAAAPGGGGGGGGDGPGPTGEVDPRDPFQGGNPLAELPTRELLIQWPTLLRQYIYSGVLWYREHPDSLRAELLSGVTVACMQVPESVAFSFVAGVDPLSGLFSTVFLGIITGLIGGKPGMISGAAGAMAVVAKDITDEKGPLKDLTSNQRFEHLMMTMTLCGAIQMAFGFLKLGGLVRLIPSTAMLGFMNALAIIIFMSQLSAFQTCPSYDLFTDCKESEREDLTLSQTTTWMMIIIVFMTMTVMYLWPKTPRVGKFLPGSMVALIVASIWEHAINRAVLDVPTRIVSETAKVKGDFPPFDLADLKGSARWGVIVEYAFSLAAIGLVESIMTLQACNEITSTPQSVFRANQESVAQGLANFVSSLFGAMGGDAMIGQSTINIMNGARGRLSSTSAGVFLLIFILVASPVIELLPIAGLTGVLFMVVINTFHWATFAKLTRMRASDGIVLVVVTVLSVLYNLAIGVVIGVVLTSIFGAWNLGSKITVTRKIVHNPNVGDIAVYKVYGTLFFAGTTHFKNAFDVKGDPHMIVADFENCLLVDYSAVAAIKSIFKRYRETDKRFLVKHLGDDSRELFKKEKKLSVALKIHDEVEAREIVVLAGVKEL